jgi:hypothetical protein
MQFTMKQSELITAVKDYVAKIGINCQVTEVDFTATRGADGIITTIDIGDLIMPGDDVVVPIKTEAKPANVFGAKSVKDVDPKAVIEDVSETAGESAQVDTTESTEDVEIEIPKGKSLFGG